MKEATAARQKWWVEREEQLSRAAVDVVASISARDRAEQSAARSIGTMLALQVSLTEVGERCGLPVKEVTRLKRSYLDSVGAATNAVGPATTTVAGLPRNDGPRS